MTTHLGAAGGALGWLFVEWKHRGKPTALGVASGLVAGLVAITPAAGFVSPLAAIIIGFVAACVCYSRRAPASTSYGYDDSLDAFGVHGVGGLAGALLTGVFAQKRRFPASTSPSALTGSSPATRSCSGPDFTCAVSAVYAAGVTWGYSSSSTSSSACG